MKNKLSKDNINTTVKSIICLVSIGLMFVGYVLVVFGLLIQDILHCIMGISIAVIYFLILAYYTSDPKVNRKKKKNVVEEFHKEEEHDSSIAQFREDLKNIHFNELHCSKCKSLIQPGIIICKVCGAFQPKERV